MDTSKQSVFLNEFSKNSFVCVCVSLTLLLPTSGGKISLYLSTY